MDKDAFVRPLAAGLLCPLLPLLSLVPLLLPGAARAQSRCFDFGSVPRPARIEAGPRLLECAGGTVWPQWHLLTPPHREPAPRPGYDPGDARELPRVLVAYRCTGLLLAPIAILRVRRMGYVIDQPEIACSPTVMP
jgi:hypothetical protein